MRIQNCDCRSSCLILAFAASVIVGIVGAILQFTAFITVTSVFYWVTFGIAIGFLAILLVTALTADNTRLQDYCCSSLSALIAGILGTILLSAILLAVTFAATSVLGAIVLGALLAFFTLTITATTCLIKSCGSFSC